MSVFENPLTTNRLQVLTNACSAMGIYHRCLRELIILLSMTSYYH